MGKIICSKFIEKLKINYLNSATGRNRQVFKFASNKIFGIRLAEADLLAGRNQFPALHNGGAQDARNHASHRHPINDMAGPVQWTRSNVHRSAHTFPRDQRN